MAPCVPGLGDSPPSRPLPDSGTPRFSTMDQGTFSELHVVEPIGPHTHTAILLHARGSSGPELAEELLDSKVPGHRTFLHKLGKGWRLVFPTATGIWCSDNDEELASWFDSSFFPCESVPLAVMAAEDIDDSTKSLQNLLDDEAKKLGHRTGRIVLGGVNQGCAIGLYAMISWRKRLGAFVGACGWLPFSKQIDSLAAREVFWDDDFDVSELDLEAAHFVTTEMPILGFPTHDSVRSALVATPVYLGHGTDDAVVDIELGRTARDSLVGVGFNVAWVEYEGAALNGHWLEVPKQGEDMANFMLRAVPGTSG
ncbi:Acyl-protein thioesterase 1 [Purpureocillium lavendulum]|uniref:Acyl-protein thioesterase 1 n=1 Tax=Purpureocillium lavendulum TaxID=1247861 RepID=A0AB34FQZ5_9HYPO|nr:Acyl-protein thioesterase 1 [Purpureocillium lavendulum]